MELTKEHFESLKGFVLEVLDDFPELGSFDGFDIQDLAEKHKILIPQTMYAPCGQFCRCKEEVYDEEWQEGVKCYRLATWLIRDAEQPSERNSDTPAASPKTKWYCEHDEYEECSCKPPF